MRTLLFRLVFILSIGNKMNAGNQRQTVHIADASSIRDLRIRDPLGRLSRILGENRLYVWGQY